VHDAVGADPVAPSARGERQTRVNEATVGRSTEWVSARAERRGAVRSVHFSAATSRGRDAAMGLGYGWGDVGKGPLSLLRRGLDRSPSPPRWRAARRGNGGASSCGAFKNQDRRGVLTSNPSASIESSRCFAKTYQPRPMASSVPWPRRDGAPVGETTDIRLTRNTRQGKFGNQGHGFRRLCGRDQLPHLASPPLKPQQRVAPAAYIRDAPGPAFRSKPSPTKLSGSSSIARRPASSPSAIFPATRQVRA
jgi:hypothetical protein